MSLPPISPGHHSQWRGFPAAAAAKPMRHASGMGLAGGPPRPNSLKAAALAAHAPGSRVMHLPPFNITRLTPLNVGEEAKNGKPARRGLVNSIYTNSHLTNHPTPPKFRLSSFAPSAMAAAAPKPGQMAAARIAEVERAGINAVRKGLKPLPLTPDINLPASMYEPGGGGGGMNYAGGRRRKSRRKSRKNRKSRKSHH